MKKLSILVVGLGISLGLGACSSKLDKAISESEGWKDKMCACKDKECAEKVSADFKTWRKDMREKFKDDKDKPSEDQMKKLMEIEKAYRECERKLESPADTGGAPTPPPAGEPEKKPE
jgi:hypothetical protein